MSRYPALSITASLSLLLVSAVLVSAGGPPSRDIGSPTDITISVEGSSIIVTWDVPDIGAPTVTGYNVYRAVNGSSFSILEGTGASDMTYQDSDIAIHGTYRYRITALSGPVESSPSDEVSMVYEKDPPVIDISPELKDRTLSIDDLILSWSVSDPGSGVASVKLSIDGRPFIQVAHDGEKEIQGLTEGSHSVDLSAVDRAGNSNEMNIEYRVDRTSPSITPLSLDQGSIISTPVFNITWTVDDDSEIADNSIKIDNSPSIALGEDQHYLWNVPSSKRSIINISSMDAGGNIGYRRISVICDLVPPVVRILDPVDGEYLDSSNAEIVFSLSDEGTGVKDLVLEIDGEVQDAVRSQDRFYLENLSDGSHGISLTAIDHADQEASDSIEVIVDTVEPSLEVLSPLEGDLIHNTEFSFSWESQDDLSGISRVQYSMDGQRWTRTAVSSGEMIIRSRPGPAKLYIAAFDNAGNEVRRIINITIDIYKPEIDGYGPTGDLVGIDTHIWAVFNEDMEPGSVEIDVSGIQGMITGGPRNFQFQPEYNLEPGMDYTVEVTGRDLAGNSARDLLWRFTVKDTALIYGRVFDENGVAMEGARIISDSGRSGITDIQGNFEMEIKSTDKNITVINDGYMDKRVQIDLSRSNRTRISNIFMEIEGAEREDDLPDPIKDPYNYLVGALILIVLILSIYLIKGSPAVEKRMSRDRK